MGHAMAKEKVPIIRMYKKTMIFLLFDVITFA